MAQNVYTLLIPVALLYTEENQFDALRVVKCKVTCSKPVYSKYKDETLKSKKWSLRMGYITQEEYDKAAANIAVSAGSTIIPAAMSTLIVDKLVSYAVVEISLRDFTKDKSLRQQLVSSVSNFSTMGVNINGVRAITQVYKDKVVGRGILYPLISFEGIATKCIHGFFDFTGAWHEGVNCIPCQPPYIQELRLLQHSSCLSGFDLNAAVLQNGAKDTDATLLGSIALSERQNPSCFIQQVQKVDTAAAAARMLMGQSENGQIFRVGDYYNSELLQPTILVPQDACSVIIQEAHNTQEAKALRRLHVSAGVKKISLMSRYSPEIVGWQRVQLHDYSGNFKELTQFALPERICADITDTSTSFVLSCDRANYLGPVLNLSAVMTDAHNIQLYLGNQPWDSIVAPCARSKFILNARINRPDFKVVTTPQRNTITPRGAATTTVESAIVFDTTTGGVQKQVLLNFGTLTPWYGMYIALATHAPDGYNNFDGTQNKVQLLIGVEGKLRRYVKENPMSLTTDCSMTENIIAQNISVLYYALRKLPLKKGEQLKASGSTHITGNIGVLHILIEPHASKGPVKDIYIDGSVQNIVVSFTDSVATEVTTKMRGTLEDNLAHVRVHIKDKSHLTSVVPEAGAVAHGRVYKLTENGVTHKGKITTARKTLTTGTVVLKSIVV